MPHLKRTTSGHLLARRPWDVATQTFAGPANLVATRCCPCPDPDNAGPMFTAGPPLNWLVRILDATTDDLPCPVMRIAGDWPDLLGDYCLARYAGTPFRGGLTDPVVWRAVVPDFALQVRKFSGSDCTGDSIDYTDLYVEYAIDGDGFFEELVVVLAPSGVAPLATDFSTHFPIFTSGPLSDYRNIHGPASTFDDMAQDCPFTGTFEMFGTGDRPYVFGACCGEVEI